MNNFIVSPEKIRQMRVWLYAIVIATILTYARPFLFSIDSGNVGLIAARTLFDSEWFIFSIHIAYWVLFVWVIGQLLMSFPPSMKWTRGALWVVLAAYVVHILFGYIIPLPDFSSPSFQIYQYVSSGISMIYTAAILFFGYLLIRNHHGRMRQLGIALCTWQLVPFLTSGLFIVFFPLPTLLQLGFQFLQMVLTIIVFIAMRRVYVPMWN